MFTPDILEHVLDAYCLGLFPMAASADAADFSWYEAPRRGLLPIAELHVPRRLQKTLRQNPFQITADRAFAAVIDGCAAFGPRRTGTWINGGIRDLFIALHKAGHAHSVECWRDGVLVGGIYGLALEGAFCAESMFSRAADASKVALVHLAARLWVGGFTVLDTQVINPHLLQFGGYEVPHAEYLALLRQAAVMPAQWPAAVSPTLLQDYLSTLNLGSARR